MADPYVRQARGVFSGTVGSTTLAPGTPVYFDGTDWEKADATDNTKFAEAFATNDFAIAAKGTFCRYSLNKKGHRRHVLEGLPLVAL